MEESPRILGVDDSLTIRKALELVLKPAGYNLELAASGAEAIEKAKTFHPSVMLLDFILPDMRGTEVCKRLASDPETAMIPVVLVSAKGAEIRQAYQDIGNVVNYITKPFTPDDVTGVVAEVLTRLKEGSLFKPQPVVVEAPAPAAAAEVQPPAGIALTAPPPMSVAAPIVAAPVAPAVAPTAPFAASIEVTPLAPPVAAAAAVAVEKAPAEAWEEAEDVVEDEAQSAALTRQRQRAVAGRREALEVLFETLSTGLEGVYVEEVDTPAGAAADEAKSYTDLVSQLTRQLGETLSQAKAGLRFALSNGSIRSLDEALFDAFRRLCRLLFRAVAAGAVEQERGIGRARVLVACRNDSPLFETLNALTHQETDWHTLVVAERFRQLPIMTRLYGPSHLIVETSRHAALWDQLKIVRRMPEGRRLKIVGVSRSDAAANPVDAATLTELGIQTVLEDGPDLLVALHEKLGGVASIVPVAAPDARDSVVDAAAV